MPSTWVPLTRTSQLISAARKAAAVPLLLRVQQQRTPARDRAVRLLTACGTHDFYVPFLALALWTAAPWLGQALIVALARVAAEIVDR